MEPVAAAGEGKGEMVFRMLLMNASLLTFFRASSTLQKF